MTSPFRPAQLPDPGILDNHRPLLRRLERRGLIRGGLSLGALTLLTGCDLDRPASVDWGLRRISAFNDWVHYQLFDRG